jgi:cytoplasmic tRNA 2-thiolation protein 2
VKYVHSKVVKRMESFRVRHATEGQKRILLLPLSFGPSSTALLHILDQHLQGQEKRTGRRGFYLHVVHITDAAAKSQSSDLLGKFKQRFPDHEYSESSLSVLFEGHGAAEILQSVGIQLDAEPNASSGSAADRLQTLLQSLPSATARADVVTLLQTRLIVQIAKASGCEAVLWGDSTTKLAEKTLAEAAKGRGFSIVHQVSDGPSPHGVAFHYPMKELLKKELVAFAGMSEPPLASLILDEPASKPAPAVTKNSTIDDLMRQYFASVEENYPSVVANVVRTTDKLQALPLGDSDETCALCQMPVTDGKFGLTGWGGDQEHLEPTSGSAKIRLCYGCSRSAPLAAAE